MPNPLTKLSAYLAGLPNGLESYPGCLVKAAIARPFLTDSVPPALLAGAGLPAPVAALLGDHGHDSSWIPEVEVWAALAAVQDLLGLDEGAALEWFEQRDREALTNPVLRLVMNFSSVEFLLPLGSGYWAMTHKNSRLSLERAGPQEALLLLDYPPGLFNEGVAKLLTAAYAVPLKLSRAKTAEVTLASWTPTRATFRARWT